MEILINILAFFICWYYTGMAVIISRFKSSKAFCAIYSAKSKTKRLLTVMLWPVSALTIQKCKQN
jgi:hypothetical protein